MSGGPPHPHNRNVNPNNSAWNHLQVPSYFPRQPQLAHMQSEHTLLHQPTWHTPTTTDALKILPPANMLNDVFKNDSVFPRDCVDLSLTRNGNPNGDITTAPTAISLSVRDTSKINSLPANMLDIQAKELTKCVAPILKSASSPSTIRSISTSPGLITPNPKSLSPGRKTPSPGSNSLGGVLVTGSLLVSNSEMIKNQKRSNIRVDSFLERLNPASEKLCQETLHSSTVEKFQTDKFPSQIQSVIVQTASSHDENSNSSSTTNAPKEDDSLNSNEDSLDSMKSRRKRKPSKTVRLPKDEAVKMETLKPFSDLISTTQQNHEDLEDNKSSITANSDPSTIATILEGNKISENRQCSDELSSIIPAKTCRKESSESETIDNIAAMVQEGLKEKEKKVENIDTIKKDDVKISAIHKEEMSNLDKDNMSDASQNDNATKKHVTVSVIKTKDTQEETSRDNDLSRTSSPSIGIQSEITTSSNLVQKIPSITHFVEVENKLEEMFAGIVENNDPTHTNVSLNSVKNDSILGLVDESLLKVDKSPISPSQKDASESTINKNQEVFHHEKKSPCDETKEDENRTDTKKNRKTRASSRNDVDGDILTKKSRLTKMKSGELSIKRNSRSAAATSVKSPKKQNVTNTSHKSPVRITNSDITKDILVSDSCSNSSSYKPRGPFIQIRGPRDSPLSVSVVNTPQVGDDDGDKKILKGKKFHDDSEYRNKVRSKGLHCSTLSNKYDAERKDASWICAFCKRGPHASELTGPSVVSEVTPPGDLFGPYFISANSPDFERRLDDPYDRQFKSKKIGRLLDEAALNSIKSGKKTKRKSESGTDAADKFLGVTDTGNDTYEIWFHENCLVWSSGVYLVGPKISGLEEAVWTCSNITCSSCGLKGANITCLKRGCLSTSHLCCARKAHWKFDEENFKVYCPAHSY